MALLDSVQNAFHKVFPEKKQRIPLQAGIGSNGHVPFDDDMIVSKPAIIFHASQTFFNFLALCCYASVAAFQGRNGVGPSGLSGFAIFISLAGMFFSLFVLLTPVIYEKYDRGARLARALKEVRVSFILVGTGLVTSLLIAFITTISSWTQPGCKNPDNDPHADKGDDFKRGLDGFCSTKKAGAVFFWFVFIFWVCSTVLAVMDYRNGKNTRPRDPPFTHPTEPTEPDHVTQEDEESLYQQQHQPTRKSTYDYDDENESPFADRPTNNRYSGVPNINAPPMAYNTSRTSQSPTATSPQGRPSMDAYGAFSDPPPSGFGSVPQLPPSNFGRPLSPPVESPRVSRTMQFADPYAAIQATVATSGPGGRFGGSGSGNTSPSYGGYR